MSHVEMPQSEREALEARISQLALGVEVRVRFTSRGSRVARVARIRPDGARLIQTYSPKNDKWSSPRRLTADDLKLG